MSDEPFVQIAPPQEVMRLEVIAWADGRISVGGLHPTDPLLAAQLVTNAAFVLAQNIVRQGRDGIIQAPAGFRVNN